MSAAVFPLLAIVPVRSAHEADPLFLLPLGSETLIDPTLESAERQAERGAVTLCVTTDDRRIAEHAGKRKAPWSIKMRDRAETEGGYFAALKGALEWATARNGGPFASVLILEPSHPFRPRGLIGNAIEMMGRDAKLDSVVSVVREYGNLWNEDDRGRLHRITTRMGRGFFREIAGLCLLTRPATLAADNAVGHDVGFVVVEEQWSLIDIHGAEGVAMARRFHDMLGRVE